MSADNAKSVPSDSWTGDFWGEGCLAGQSICTATTVLVIEKTKNEKIRAHILSRNIRVEEDLLNQLFNSSEKRLARTLLLLAHYVAEGNHKTALPKVHKKRWQK